jgi:hypothetical protein
MLFAFVCLIGIALFFLMRSAQACFDPRITPNRPMKPTMTPAMSIQTALSVGDPVKNLETSELNEFVACTPKIMSITPPMSRTIEIILFIKDLSIRLLI